MGRDDARKVGRFFVVEDDPVLVKYMALKLRERFSVKSAATVGEALREIAVMERPMAMSIDGRLPDGSGLTVLKRAHAGFPDLPILVWTAFPGDVDLTNGAQAARAELAIKSSPEQLLGFGRRVLIEAQGLDGPLSRRTNAVAEWCRLSLCETELVALAVADASRVEAADRLGVGIGTVKTQAARIQEKTGRSLLALGAHIRSGKPLKVAGELRRAMVSKAIPAVEEFDRECGFGAALADGDEPLTRSQRKLN